MRGLPGDGSANQSSVFPTPVPGVEARVDMFLRSSQFSCRTIAGK